MTGPIGRSPFAGAVLACACAVATVHAGAGTGSADAVSWPLDERTTIALVEDHRVPLVSLVVEFPVGSWSAWARENHAREAWEIQLHDVAGGLRKRADRLAARLEVSMGPRSASIRASCLRRDLDAVLDLLRDVLNHRDFDRRRLKRWKRQRKIGWETRRRQPAFRLEQTVRRLRYAPDDPRRLEYEEPPSFPAKPERLVVVRDRIARLGGRVVGFAGAVTREEAQRAATGLLPAGSVEAIRDLRPVPGVVVPAAGPVEAFTVTMPRIEQVFFALVRESPTVGDPEYPAFLVADHVLGGHFFSRLSVALRHEGGETYGASTSGRGDTWTEPYALTTFTRADNADATERKLRAVLAAFRADGIEERERAAAAGFLLGRRAFSRQSPGQRLERWLVERRLGLAAGTYAGLAERAAALSLDEINAFIRKFYDPRLFSLVRVAPGPS